MRGRPARLTVESDDATRTTWEGWLRRQTIAAGWATRARAMVLLAEGQPSTHTAAQVGLAERHVRTWAKPFASSPRAGRGCPTGRDRAARPFSPPAVALHAVKIACERPDDRGRSRAQGDCAAIARTLVAEGRVEAISDETGRRILGHHKLKPGRHHLWLSATTPRAAACGLRPAPARCRRWRTSTHARWNRGRSCCAWTRGRSCCAWTRRPAGNRAPGGHRPVRRAAGSRCASRTRPSRRPSLRGGALNLFAAFDTRRGPVYAATAPRRRQVEFSAVRAVRAQLDREIPAALTTIHLVVDNGRLPTGAVVRAWLAAPPRFCGPVPPVHGSWMNQGDQWFSMLPRKRLRCADVADLAHLAARLQAFVTAWHQHAHPFQWSRKSVATVMAPCERPLAKAA